MVERSAGFDRQVVDSRKYLVSLANKLCHNSERAEDLAQHTILIALDKCHSFQDGSNLKAWLTVILRNQFFTEQRKRRREIEDVDGVFSLHLSVDESQTWSVDLRIVRKRMKMMPLEYRKPFEMVCIMGEDYETVAQAMNCPVGTIKSRVSRAREFIENGDEIKEVEPVVEEKNHDGMDDRIAILYRSGKSIGEIAAEIGGIKRSYVMSVIAAKNIVLSGAA
jgi:RNA polymerase sigma-70 factor, ECF subfamily